jgi:sodium/pantothenate symporter
MSGLLGILLADTVSTGSGWAIMAFVIYMLAVIGLAWLSNRTARQGSFLSDYFLGNRSLGTWAFALTFAATSASGGSFIGFPALVYTHGWVVALWIGGYMIVPLVAMGLLGRRLNQVARRSQAITIPDVLRDRFESPGLGALATGLIVFFMIFNLVAQFKGGSVILQTLLQDEPLFQAASRWLGAATTDVPGLSAVASQPSYALCLGVFSLVVVFYTAYGGFRAVVWTDVMQGFVMLAGVLILLPLTLWSVGGLENATRRMAEMTPPRWVELRLTRASENVEESLALPRNTWLAGLDPRTERRRVFRLSERCEFPSGETTASVDGRLEVSAIELTDPQPMESVASDPLTAGLDWEVLRTRPYAAGAATPGGYVSGPGPAATQANGFLPIGLAISFFLFWTFAGAGQPSNMVRLMAFQDTKTLQRAIVTVSCYFTAIYLPLVIVFCCSRVLLPGWETEPDRIMPEMAKVTSTGIGMPWLAGLLVAAPFAAVMSTMDSFLLMISSAVVRDIYQRHIAPDASESTLKRWTYVTTVLVGSLAMIAALYPPRFLQDIIVFTGSGLSTCFLIPVFGLLYWPRFNRWGAIASMLAGFATHVGLYVIGAWQQATWQMVPYQPWGLHPFIIGTMVSSVAAILVTMSTPGPDAERVRLYFGISNETRDKR